MRELAHRTYDVDSGVDVPLRRGGTAALNREPGRVVAAILERTQTLDQDGNAVSRTDVADDSAHEAGILRGGAPPAAECTSPCSLQPDACFPSGVFVGDEACIGMSQNVGHPEG